MERKLSKAAIRVRRRIMHRITRNLTHDDANKKAAFDKYYKDLVHEAITVVLATEEMLPDALHRSRES